MPAQQGSHEQQAVWLRSAWPQASTSKGAASSKRKSTPQCHTQRAASALNIKAASQGGPRINHPPRSLHWAYTATPGGDHLHVDCLYIKIETEPRIGQFLQAALLLPAGKRPKKAKKPDCVPIWWLSGHITAKKSQIWLDISQISTTSEQLQLARAAAAAQCAPSKRQIWLYMALLSR